MNPLYISDVYQPLQARDVLGILEARQHLEDAKVRNRLLYQKMHDDDMQQAQQRAYMEAVTGAGPGENALTTAAPQFRQPQGQQTAPQQSGQMNPRVMAVGNMLQGLGANPQQIAGALGGLSMETNGLDPNAVNPKSGAFGIGQWLGSRLTGLKSFAASMGKPANDFDVQVAYLKNELTGNEANSLQALLGSGNTQQAVDAWTDKFERSKAGSDLRRRGVQYADSLSQNAPFYDANGRELALPSGTKPGTLMTPGQADQFEQQTNALLHPTNMTADASGRIVPPQTQPQSPQGQNRPPQTEQELYAAYGRYLAQQEKLKQKKAVEESEYNTYVKPSIDKLFTTYSASRDNKGWHNAISMIARQFPNNEAVQRQMEIYSHFDLDRPGVASGTIKGLPASTALQILSRIPSFSKTDPAVVEAIKALGDRPVDIPVKDGIASFPQAEKSTDETKPNALQKAALDKAAGLKGAPLNAEERYKVLKGVQDDIGKSRYAGYMSARQANYLDTKDNQIVTMSYEDAVQANKKQPGKYLMTTPGETDKALKGGALVRDIQGSIQQTQAAINGLKNNFTAAQRTKLYEAAKSNNPTGAINNLITGSFGKSLTPDQEDYLVQVQQLIEQAMAMRQVLGLGQGSDEMRRAITNTIPSAGSFSKSYATKQLKAFEQVLKRVSRGIPLVKLGPGPLGDDGSSPPAGPPSDGEYSDDEIKAEMKRRGL